MERLFVQAEELRDESRELSLSSCESFCTALSPFEQKGPDDRADKGDNCTDNDCPPAVHAAERISGGDGMSAHSVVADLDSGVADEPIDARRPHQNVGDCNPKVSRHVDQVDVIGRFREDLEGFADVFVSLAQRRDVDVLQAVDDSGSSASTHESNECPFGALDALVPYKEHAVHLVDDSAEAPVPAFGLVVLDDPAEAPVRLGLRWPDHAVRKRRTRSLDDALGHAPIVGAS